MKGQQSAKIIVVLFLISGFIYTFSYKLQGSQIVQQGGEQKITKTFFHPYMQGVTFFVGESLCILLLYRQGEMKQKKSYPTTIFIIPAVSDLFSVMLQCTALALISGSTFMMLKGASIVTTLVFSNWLFNFQVRSRHLVGCGLAIIGLMIVGLADILLADKVTTVGSSNNLHAIGYAIMVISLIFNGFLYAYEQKLLKQYKVSPLQMVGWEGVYGTIFSISLVIILCFIPCPYKGNKCVYSFRNQSYMEIPSVYFYQVFTNPFLLLLVLSGMISNAFYNYYGVTITQTMDSLTRSLLNVCRTGLIWLFGIVVSLNVSPGSPYQIQSLKISVNFVKAIGFFSIIVGTLVYNRTIFQKQMSKLDDRWYKNIDGNKDIMKKLNEGNIIQQQLGKNQQIKQSIQMIKISPNWKPQTCSQLSSK